MTERHSRGRRPAQRMRTPIAASSSRRRRMTSLLKPIRNRTSSGERRQFSVENAYAEIVDAVRAIAREAAAGRLNPGKIDERTIAAHLDEPDLPDVDLFIRTSGEQRTSNFLLWQAAYAELVFIDTPWPDFDRRHLWSACAAYAARERRFGSAGPVEVKP